MTNTPDCESLERITQEFASIIDEIWIKYSKYVNITKYFKAL